MSCWRRRRLRQDIGNRPERHYPTTPYSAKAKAELKKLNQPVDTE